MFNRFEYVCNASVYIKTVQTKKKMKFTDTEAFIEEHPYKTYVNDKFVDVIRRKGLNLTNRSKANLFLI